MLQITPTYVCTYAHSTYIMFIPTQIKFALLSPSTVMWPHTSKANTKLRMVFTLQDSDGAAVVVAQEQR